MQAEVSLGLFNVSSEQMTGFFPKGVLAKKNVHKKKAFYISLISFTFFFSSSKVYFGRESNPNLKRVKLMY